MAALRQLLNSRGMVRDNASEEEHRRADAKMHAAGYSRSQSPSQSIPDRSRPHNTGNEQGPRPLHSKFNDTDPSSWHNQHPALRNQGSSSFDRSNSVDTTSTTESRPHLNRSATETSVHADIGMSRQDVTSYTSLYDENESPALSPALNKHLALRPLQTQTQEHAFPPSKQRHRSRSVTEKDEYYKNGGSWDGYAKDYADKPLPGQGDSLKAEQKKAAEKLESRSMQTLRDRQRTPTENNSGAKYDHQQQNLAMSPQGPTKVAHTFKGSDGSPTESISSNASSPTNSRKNLKRSRDLDYSMDQLADMEYRQLKDESFDNFPESASLIARHKLPDPKLPLSERLHSIYSDRTHKDKASRARGFFASLTIDQYEECGDLLLDGFRDVMDRLKEARQQKRKAAKAMEEQIAKREGWVRRKRSVCEQELGRLKNAGTAVVKPVKTR